MYRGETLKLDSYDVKIDDLVKDLKLIYEKEIHQPIFDSLHDKDEEDLETPETKLIKKKLKEAIR